MNPVKIRVSPAAYGNHTELTIHLPLPRSWTPWELQYFCDVLTAHSGRHVRFVLPADSPSEWLDVWCAALADAASMRIEVQFSASRLEPRSRRAGAPAHGAEGELFGARRGGRS
jgi:hypothetical protein